MVRMGSAVRFRARAQGTTPVAVDLVDGSRAFPVEDRSTPAPGAPDEAA
jgi:hypothetical protein